MITALFFFIFILVAVLAWGVWEIFFYLFCIWVMLWLFSIMAKFIYRWITLAIEISEAEEAKELEDGR
jgi:hypothetical protein